MNEPPFTCQFCGAPSHVDPSDQSPPAVYCLPVDHAEVDPDALAHSATIAGLVPFADRDLAVAAFVRVGIDPAQIEATQP